MCVTCEFENNRLDGLNDIKNKLVLDMDLGNHTSLFEISMTMPLEKKGISIDFRENKINGVEETLNNFFEEYIDVNSFFEYSVVKIQLLHDFTSIIHLWYQLFFISYCQFSNMCGSIFDLLLRTLSCSAVELTFCK
ncbi:hypothetical protein RND81_10G078500 [Saponaria officinalis]|uniref:Uncharacterized protein n=1 Tax=Saponaria officinalis TaxID=3572 RepID=A0AAW1I1N2_SAPOF